MLILCVLLIPSKARKDFAFFHWQGGASLLKALNHTHTQNRPNTPNAACGPTGAVDVAKFRLILCVLLIPSIARKDFGFFHWQGGASLLKAPNHTHTQNRPNTHNAACGPTGAVDVAKCMLILCVLLIPSITRKDFAFFHWQGGASLIKAPNHTHTQNRPNTHNAACGPTGAVDVARFMLILCVLLIPSMPEGFCFFSFARRREPAKRMDLVQYPTHPYTLKTRTWGPGCS